MAGGKKEKHQSRWCMHTTESLGRNHLVVTTFLNKLLTYFVSQSSTHELFSVDERIRINTSDCNFAITGALIQTQRFNIQYCFNQNSAFQNRCLGAEGCA